eukprot:1157842-Pelagomonas_calceolata.AAC.9
MGHTQMCNMHRAHNGACKKKNGVGKVKVGPELSNGCVQQAACACLGPQMRQAFVVMPQKAELVAGKDLKQPRASLPFDPLGCAIKCDGGRLFRAAFTYHNLPMSTVPAFTDSLGHVKRVEHSSKRTVKRGEEAPKRPF